jgi:hypothetical protein
LEAGSIKDFVIPKSEALKSVTQGWIMGGFFTDDVSPKVCIAMMGGFFTDGFYIVEPHTIFCFRQSIPIPAESSVTLQCNFFQSLLYIQT